MSIFGDDLSADCPSRVHVYRYLITLKSGGERGKSLAKPLNIVALLRGELGPVVEFVDFVEGEFIDGRFVEGKFVEGGAVRVEDIAEIEPVSEADYQGWLADETSGPYEASDMNVGNATDECLEKRVAELTARKAGGEPLVEYELVVFQREIDRRTAAKRNGGAAA